MRTDVVRAIREDGVNHAKAVADIPLRRIGDLEDIGDGSTMTLSSL